MTAGHAFFAIFLALLLFGAPTCRAMEAAVAPATEDSHNSGVLHFVAGASSALLVSAIAYPLVAPDDSRPFLAAGLGVSGSLIAGAVKEIMDLFGWGDPSWTDLLLTVAGGLLAGSMVYILTSAEPSAESGTCGLPAVYGAFALVLSLPVAENLWRRVSPSSVSR